MDTNNVHLIYFSPTHTSKKIATAIAKGIAAENNQITDLTFGIEESIVIKQGLTVIAVPVYCGRVSETALQRLRKIKGRQTPAIIAVVYGNRHYDDALIELRDEVIQLGFIPVAGGAFIGEHSYSTEKHPVAANRPDFEDLRQAESFGKEVAERLKSISDITTLPLLKVKGNVPYLTVKTGQPSTPITQEELCAQCGHCIGICPTDAIRLEEKVVSDPETCIQCCACVKECPHGARSYFTPFAEVLSTHFSKRREREVFFHFQK